MPSVDEKNALSRILADIDRPCILELGAHKGEESFWLRAACKPGQMLNHIMVEPDPRNCQTIINAEPLSDFRRLIIGAVADDVEMRPFQFAFNVDDKTHASGSLREPTGHLFHFPQVKFTHVGAVQCYSLDWIFHHQNLTKIDLLYVDIQGAENMMIAGGQTALRHSRYLFMEVENVELYAGEALKGDLIAMLPGWEVVQEFEYNVLLRNTNFRESGS